VYFKSHPVEIYLHRPNSSSKLKGHRGFYRQDGNLMAEIRPFRGVRYNQNKIRDMAKVLCPPYDIISPAQQDELYRASEFNFVRIEYNQELAQDNPQDNRYTRASANLTNWLEEGILEVETAPALYLHLHHFTCQGKSYRRQNILAGVKLVEWETRIVRPHENIIPKAKSDRLSMLHACQANTSPVLAMYEDPEKIIKSILEEQERRNPVIDFIDPWGERHQVWAVTQPQAIKIIQGEITKQALYIADGHHRYDSALTYKRERAAQATDYSGEEGFNFVLTSLIDFADPGMVILPTHRMVRGISGPVLAGLPSQLTAFFDIEKVSLREPATWQKVDARLTGMAPESRNTTLAVYGLDRENILILTVKDQKTVDQLMPAFHSDLYRKLDVSLVDHIILEKLVGYHKENEDIVLAYEHDRQNILNHVKAGEYQMAFILNPVRPQIIRGIADAGDRMPRKSTYFFPKSPAGLVVYKW
jgi:uncharacterized protein (DUF1015 family)